VSFEKLENNILDAIVINKIQYKILTKQDNLKYLEELVSQII
jgi:hypothetical protein